MRKYKYQKNTGKITFLDTLEIITLNPTAHLIFGQLNDGLSIELIAQKMTQQYQVSYNNSLADIKNLKNELIELGINFNQRPNNNSYTPTTAICHIIQNCNSKCKMCDCWKIKKTNLITRKHLRPFFEKLKLLGCKEIMISGGEPLLHPELKVILNDIKELGMHQLLNTNALLLDQQNWIHHVDLDELVVSMDDASPDSYKQLRGIDAYKKICMNIKKFKQNSTNTKIKIRTTINKYNYNKIHKIFDFANQNRISGIGFSPADINSTSFSRHKMDKTRANKLKKQILPSLFELELFIKEFQPSHFQYKLLDQMALLGISQWNGEQYLQCLKYYREVLSDNHLFYENKPCAFPDIAMVLDYDGCLKNCFYSESFGNIQNLANINWNTDAGIKKLISNSTCSTCRGKIFCDMEKI